MCLYIDIKVLNAPRKKAGEITKLGKKSRLLPLQAIATNGSDNFCRFFLSPEVENRCACFLLTEKSDWKNATWELDEKKLKSLANTIEFLSKYGSQAIHFQAYWHGKPNERPSQLQQTRLKLKDFLKLVRSNSISTHSVYHIVLGAG